MLTSKESEHLLHKNRVEHAKTCPTRGERHCGYARCCEKAVEVRGICVCRYVLCCPEHGHACIGNHE